MAHVTTANLERALIAQGLIPIGCRLLEVSITPNAPLVMRYEVFVSEEDYAKFAAAFQDAVRTTDDQ